MIANTVASNAAEGLLSMKIIGIDPGTKESGIVIVEKEMPTFAAKINNPGIIQHLYSMPFYELAIEGMQHYGMPLGKDVFTTLLWAGRFWEAAASRSQSVFFYTKPEWTRTICGPYGKKDSDVRRALLARFGDDKKGEPLHILKGNSDKRSAFGVAIHHSDICKLSRACRSTGVYRFESGAPSKQERIKP